MSEFYWLLLQSGAVGIGTKRGDCWIVLAPDGTTFSTSEGRIVDAVQVEQPQTEEVVVTRVTFKRQAETGE